MPAAASPGDSEDIRLQGPIRVGGDHTFHPFEFIARPGFPEGLYVDLTRAVAREAGLEVEIVLGPWDELEGALIRGDLDVIQGAILTPEREDSLEFSQPHTTVHYVSVVRRGDTPPPTAIGKLAGRRLAVQRGCLMHRFAEAHGMEERLNVFDTRRDALQQILLGRSDVALVPLYTARYWIDREEWGELLQIGQPLASREHRFAVARGRGELLARLDDGLRILGESGEYRHLRDQWVPAVAEPSMNLDLVVRYVVLVVGLLALLMVAFLLWARYLRREVLERTAELRQSEIQFRQIAENLADIIWLGDMATGRLLYINPAFERLSGRSPKRLYARSRSFLQVVHPEDRRLVGKAFRRLENGEIDEFDLEHRVLRPDGEVRWLHTRSYPIRNFLGAVIRNAGVATDITERKLAESEFAAGEERARRQRSAMARLLVDEAVTAGELPEALWRVTEILTETLDVARASVWTLSADGAALECRALLTPEGRSTVVPPLDAAELPRYFSAIRNEGRIYVEDAVADDRTSEMANGYLRPLGIASMLDAGIQMAGTLAGVVCAEHVGDPRRWYPDEEAFVTTLAAVVAQILSNAERKLAEERVRESEARARLYFEADPDALFVIGPDGSYVDVNPVAVERYGYTREEFFSMSPADLAVEDLRDQVPNRLAEVRLRELRFDWRHRTRDGREVPVAIITRPITLEGRPCVLASARDISERVELETQLRQSQKMEAIGTLAGGVAHDFNNLLQAMLTQIHLIDPQYGPSTPAAEVVGELEQLIRHGATLTRQLLLFSRRETASPELLDVNQVVKASAAMLRRLIRESVSFTVESFPEPLPVECDRGQLEQVLVNLVLNASQAMGQGGALTVRTAPAGHDAVAMEVSDTGIGIPAEHRDRIFEPFFTTRAVEHGTGLGLPVVHGIVTRHGGRVEVDSAVGRGTTFRILLPRQDVGPIETRDHKPAELAPLAPGNGERILVVEDEDAAREGLREVLLALGYGVTAVGSAEEVRDLLAGPPFDLLLTDLVLPGVQGLDLAGLLSRHWPDLRVILMSGYSQEDVVRRGAADGTLHFLQKPFDMNTLAREIREALAG